MKKPWYKKWWIWVLLIAVYFSFMVCSFAACCGLMFPTEEQETVVETTVVVESTTDPGFIPSPQPSIFTEPIEETSEAVESEPPILDITPPVEIEPTVPQENSTSITTYYVYITLNGEKYHKISCRHIQESELTELELTEAIEQGYVAYKTCKP